MPWKLNPFTNKLDYYMSLPEGMATEATLAALQADIENVKNLISQMQGVASDLRVTILSGTVTSVGTVSNQTQIGGQPATNIVQNTMDNLAVVGNVQNIAEN